MFQRALLPTDFSASAAAALKVVEEHFPGIKLCLLHVIDPKQVANSLSSPLQAEEVRNKLKGKALSQLQSLAEAEYVVSIGTAPEMILDQANLWQADLIIMGTHGRTGIDHFLNRSVAEQVVRKAKRPVLIVHEGDLVHN